MRKLIPLIVFSLFSVITFSQTLNVSGIVTQASSGETLPGVSVVVKNTARGTETDFDGKYSLSNISNGATLIFSAIGSETKEVVVTSSRINVALQESAEQLDEVVVIGYGTQRKKEVTGAIAVVSSESIEKLKPVRVEQALQGQVAGVNITSTSGSPGATSNIRIRGVSTNGNSNPLILVDGNRIEDLSTINPSDIESINVLKDATAGIYGVQAANGVILITTKSGRKKSDYKISFNSYSGIQKTSREIPMLNATEYALLANEAHAANGAALPFLNVSNLGKGTDWQDQVFQTAVMSSADISVSKGTENVAYNFSASYLDQDGIVGLDKSNFNRLTAKLNVNADILDNLKLTSSVIYTNTHNKGLPENVLGSVLFNALNFAPNLTPTDGSGNYTLTPASGFGQEVINPLAQMATTFNKTTVHKIAPTLGLTYSFLDGFSASAKMQYNYATVNSRSYFGINEFGVSSTVFDRLNNSLTNFEQGYEDYIFDAYVKYEKKFNDVHDVKVLLGTSVSKAQTHNIANQQGFDFIKGNLNSDINGGDRFEDYNLINNTVDVVDGDRLLSYFSRLQYGYDGKYLISAVLRRDGSSKFGPVNKFGFFPSASIGWVVSKESFLEDSDVINFLKLRASYGIIGNDRIPAFAFTSLLNGQGQYVFDDEIVTGVAAGVLSNPEVRWEKQKPLDIGLDITLFDKFEITVDYFKKTTEDLLVNPQVSGILGVSAPGSGLPVVNAGTVENKGFEFSIGYKQKISEDFNFGINYNFTTLDNKVLLVNGENSFVEGGSFGVGQEAPSRMEAGFPIGYFYGYQTNGVFQTQAEVDAHSTQTNANPGDLRFVDTNEDGKIDLDDRTYIGDPIADLNMGLNLTLNYKNLDFSAYAFASLGNEIVRNYERNLTLTNRPVWYLDRWTGPGTSNTSPRVTTGANGNTLFSDFYVEDGSFVRLQNVQVGYSFDPSKFGKSGIDKLRLYISANNLVTLTKYRGYDPAASGGVPTPENPNVSSPIGAGIDQGFYPTPKTFLFGLNVNF
ncbi:TonB-dependent receptor [Tenacibaculum sp. 1_MG-2023]|uniref:SusC/RagA family TonB-linked outer membrane protein n=1 Tax=Tenacibaculum sp. 1_MG-2023 TaxID=3062653 RepID=UPI0026E4969F|nr:TonB-dependent receptor [Tenacibaculum sp. 1_MG-2023]MDO6601059.1 TonB-dependent receptor [Tenacibaculum sp. 1_MG-2023]